MTVEGMEERIKELESGVNRIKDLQLKMKGAYKNQFEHQRQWALEMYRANPVLMQSMGWKAEDLIQS